MKKKNLLSKITILLLLAVLTTSCEINDPHVKQVQQLPNVEEYEATDDLNRTRHMDLGISYYRYTVLYIPVYAHDPQYVLYFKDMHFGDKITWNVHTLDEEEIQYFVDLYNISPTPKLNLWQRFGLWLILGGLLLIGLISRLFD